MRRVGPYRRACWSAEELWYVDCRSPSMRALWTRKVRSTSGEARRISILGLMQSAVLIWLSLSNQMFGEKFLPDHLGVEE